MVHEDRSRKKYPSDLTDEPWAIVGPMIPPAKQNPRGGRPRNVNMREVLHTLFSLNRSGGPWDMVPHDWLPKRTRGEAGREPTPSAACIESQAVQTPEMGGPERGEDGGKKINGRKRPLLVDTLGWQHHACSATSRPTTFRVSA